MDSDDKMKPKPTTDEHGVPLCDAKCPHHSIRSNSLRGAAATCWTHCALGGLRDGICEPAVREMTEGRIHFLDALHRIRDALEPIGQRPEYVTLAWSFADNVIKEADDGE